ncbi:hypothetical protein Tco_1120045, partial [Tanacetum coccineum]
GQCKVLTDINFDEMTYVHLLEILKRLVPNGFEKVYYCKSGAKLTSIRELKSDKDIVDMLKVGYDNGFQIDINIDEGRCAGKKGNKHRVLPRKKDFNIARLGPRMKPIITMLEEIRLYIMQRLVAMNKLAFSLEDTITPSIRKRLEILKEKQREWVVYPSGFQELEVRKGDQSYGVSLQHKFSNISFPPLPPIIRKMPGRPQKKRIQSPGETSGSQCASRGGGRSGKGDGNDGSGSGSGANNASGSGVNAGSVSAGGSDKRGGRRVGRGSEKSSRGGVFPSSSSSGILTAEHEYQLELDKQAFRECIKEQAREQAKIDAEQEKLDKERREEHKWQEKNDYFNPTIWPEESMEEVAMNQQYHKETSDEGKAKATVEDGLAPEQAKSPTVDKGKTKASVEDGPTPKKKRGRPLSSVDGIRIYNKNHGRSKRIANMKLNKPFQFDKFGTGSNPDKAFDVEE